MYVIIRQEFLSRLAEGMCSEKAMSVSQFCGTWLVFTSEVTDGGKSVDEFHTL